MQTFKLGNRIVALMKTTTKTGSFLAGYIATGKTVQEAIANCFAKINK